MNEWMNEYDLWEAYKKYQMCQIYYMLYVTLIGDTIWLIYATYRGHMPFISTMTCARHIRNATCAIYIICYMWPLLEL